MVKASGKLSIADLQRERAIPSDPQRMLREIKHTDKWAGEWQLDRPASHCLAVPAPIIINSAVMSFGPTASSRGMQLLPGCVVDSHVGGRARTRSRPRRRRPERGAPQTCRPCLWRSAKCDPRAGPSPAVRWPLVGPPTSSSPEPDAPNPETGEFSLGTDAARRGGSGIPGTMPQPKAYSSRKIHANSLAVQFNSKMKQPIWQ